MSEKSSVPTASDQDVPNWLDLSKELSQLISETPDKNSQAQRDKEVATLLKAFKSDSEAFTRLFRAALHGEASSIKEGLETMGGFYRGFGEIDEACQAIEKASQSSEESRKRWSEIPATQSNYWSREGAGERRVLLAREQKVAGHRAFSIVNDAKANPGEFGWEEVDSIVPPPDGVHSSSSAVKRMLKPIGATMIDIRSQSRDAE